VLRLSECGLSKAESPEALNVLCCREILTNSVSFLYHFIFDVRSYGDRGSIGGGVPRGRRTNWLPVAWISHQSGMNLHPETQMDTPLPFYFRKPSEPMPPPIKEPPSPMENPDAPVREPDPEEPEEI
jgi:hypothetical protein